MLCRITLSSDAHRTESVTAMDHEQTMGVNSKVLDQKQQNIFDRISLFWSEELQGSVDTLFRRIRQLSCHTMSNYVRNFDVENY